MVINGDQVPEPENELYDQFPEGKTLPGGDRSGTEEGFNTYVQINVESLFTEEALAIPAVRAFVDTAENISISFATFKSSTRESEWALHKPHLAMAGEVAGIRGPVDRFPAENPHIGTYLINHDRTMARWKWSVVVIEDGAQAGQMVYKQEDTSQEKPGFGEPRP